jgi:hypothetical protein
MSAASKAYQQLVKHEGSTRREHSVIWCLWKTTAFNSTVCMCACMRVCARARSEINIYIYIYIYIYVCIICYKMMSGDEILDDIFERIMRAARLLKSRLY